MMIRGKGQDTLKLVLLLIWAFPVFAADLNVTASVWPPYVDDKFRDYGFGVALVKDAFARAGYTAKISVESWPEALVETQNGSYDVVCSVWYTENRAESLAFSEPYITNHIKLIKRSDSNFTFTKRADLNGLKIGIVEDYAYSEQAYDMTGIEISTAGSVKANIQRLLNGEIDLVLADSRVAIYEVNQLRAAKNITILPDPLNKRGLRIAVSKKHPDHLAIVAAFDEAIAAMKEDGSYNTILANHRVSW